MLFHHCSCPQFWAISTCKEGTTFRGASQFTAAFCLWPCAPTPLALFLLFPSITLSPQRLFLVPAAQHVFRPDSEWESVSANCSINKQADLSLVLFTAVLNIPVNNDTLLHRQWKRIQPIWGTNKGPLTVEQRPKFIIRWVINSILWIASQCPHPGTIDDIQPTWLNSISKGDGWSWTHLPRNHIIAVWVNQTWIKRFARASWQTENWKLKQSLVLNVAVSNNKWLQVIFWQMHCTPC